MDPEVLSPTGGRFDEERLLQTWVGRTRSAKKRQQQQQQEKLLRGNDLGQDQDNAAASSASVWDDWQNIILLVVLYMIQGVPLGLTFGSIPFLLQDSSSYTDIGVFSFAAYPYSLKLLWSPIVDSVFFKKFGRRKSWIIPIQLLVGCILVFFCEHIHAYTKPDPLNHHHNIFVLTVAFFAIVLLVATQDIAVDGWAITMLSEANRGLASTCQSVGQNIGFFMSYTIFLALSSSTFCNDYIRSVPTDEPLVTLSGYMWMWGIIMIVSTLAIAFFKQEDLNVDPDDLSIASVYVDIWNVIRLPNILLFVVHNCCLSTLLVVLLTVRIAFGAADNVTVLKLIEKGFPREKMALMVFISFPFDVAIPILISRWTRRAGNKPMHAFLIAFPFRVLITLFGMYVVYTFPTNVEDHTLGVFARVFVVQVLYSFASNTMFVSQCSFFAEICDPQIGGTYMTLMNTIANLGGTWPKFFMLSFVDMFTVKSCSRDDPSADEVCVIERDGYYVMSFICAAYGMIWYLLMRPRIHSIQEVDTSVWRVKEPKHE